MRQTFFKELHKQMGNNKDIWAITADLGYGGFDEIQRDFPERFLNTGAAEQAAVGIAVGLALEGKIPFVYSITPFLLYRPFETIRNYIDHEKIPVKLIGSGRNRDYEIDGFSHWAEEDKLLFVMNEYQIFNFRGVLRHIQPYWPETKEEIPALVEEMVNNKRPYFLSLKR